MLAIALLLLGYLFNAVTFLGAVWLVIYHGYLVGVLLVVAIYTILFISELWKHASKTRKKADRIIALLTSVSLGSGYIGLSYWSISIILT